jgi:hypothetical protein
MEAIKKAVIEYIDYNVLISIMDFLYEKFENEEVNGQKTTIVQSYSDSNIKYTSPSISVEILHRKNRSLSFGNYLGDIDLVNSIIEVDGINFEYRVQLNVYSNTRGGNHKWSSLLDEALASGDSGITLNTYHDNGDVKEAGIGYITYNYASDVTNNNQVPNINTYDFHTIFEVKISVIQLYKSIYSIAKLDIEGDLKNEHPEENNIEN